MFDNALQDYREVALVVDEHLGTLGWVKNGDMSSVYGPNAAGKAHAAEDSDHLCADKMDEAVGQEVLDDQAYLPDSLPGCGLAHIVLDGNVAETAGGGQIHYGDGHLLLWSEGAC